MAERYPFGIRCLLAAFLTGGTGLCLAQTSPGNVNYQGRLVDGTNLVQGAHAIGFRVFASAVATNILYQETDPTTVVDGFYSTRLGDNPESVGSIAAGPPPQPLYGSLPTLLTCGSNLFLEVSLDGTAMSPRERVLAVPYAMVAGQAETVAAGGVSRDSLATGLRNTLDGSGGSVTNAVYVDSHGNVGVGTTTPFASMDIRDGVAVLTPVMLSQTIDGTGAFTNLAGARSVCVSMPFAYVAGSDDDSLSILNVSDPANPTLVTCLQDGVGGFDWLDGVYSVVKAGGYLYVSAENDDAVNIICVTNPAVPRLVTALVDGTGGYNYLDRPKEVAVESNCLYIISYNESALTIVDISNPELPAISSVVYNGLGAFTNMGSPYSIKVSGGVAYVSGLTDDAITIIDVSNPASPAWLACIRDGVDGYSRLNNPADLEVYNGYLYAAAQSDSALTIVDIRTPAAPQLIMEIVDGERGFTELSGVGALHAANGKLYIGSITDSAVTIADIRDPSDPLPIATIEPNYAGFSDLRSPEGLATAGDLFFIADSYHDQLVICSLATTNSTGDAGLTVMERVGIGTVSPREALDVNGNAVVAGDLTVFNDLYLQQYNDGQTGVLRLYANGQVYRKTSDTGIYLGVPPVEFRPVDGTVTNYHTSSYLYLDSGTGEMRAPIHFPDDSTLGYFRIRYMDTDSTDNLAVRLVRQDANSTTTTNMVSWASTGSLGSVQLYSTTAIAEDTIDNLNYTYYVSVAPEAGSTWSSNLRIYSVSVSYNISY